MNKAGEESGVWQLSTLTKIIYTIALGDKETCKKNLQEEGGKVPKWDKKNEKNLQFPQILLWRYTA